MLDLSPNNYRVCMSDDPRQETFVRIWNWHRVRLVLLAMLLWQVRGYAQLGPQPPCGAEPAPPYPDLDDSAIVKTWSRSEVGRDWSPPACTGWVCFGCYEEIQSIYFLDRESKDAWRYHSIVRMGTNANWLIAGNESTAVNRAVAFYRYLIGIPTDQEPPAAR